MTLRPHPTQVNQEDTKATSSHLLAYFMGDFLQSFSLWVAFGGFSMSPASAPLTPSTPLSLTFSEHGQQQQCTTIQQNCVCVC